MQQYGLLEPLHKIVIFNDTINIADDSVGAEVQEGEAIAVGRPAEDTAIGSGDFTLPKGKILTTPAVRRIAMEHKVSVAISVGCVIWCIEVILAQI